MRSRSSTATLIPSGRVGASLREFALWHVIGAIEPPELARIAQAAAHRLDSASYLLGAAEPIGQSLRREDGPGGPAAVAAVDEYIHLVQESAVALARCIALIEAGRRVNGFSVAASASIDLHGPALKDIRDAYEHIDERALGQVKRVAVADSLTIFDHSELVRTGTITYLHHRLSVDDLIVLTADCREIVKALIGGPPAGA